MCLCDCSQQTELRQRNTPRLLYRMVRQEHSPINTVYVLHACLSRQAQRLRLSRQMNSYTRRRARDKLDSAATYDGHCKNKSTLTDTSANFTDQPHPLSSPSVQPTSLVTFKATQRFPETTSSHFTFEFPSLPHKLSASDHESSPDPSQPFLIT